MAKSQYELEKEAEQAYELSKKYLTVGVLTGLLCATAIFVHLMCWAESWITIPTIILFSIAMVIGMVKGGRLDKKRENLEFEAQLAGPDQKREGAANLNVRRGPAAPNWQRVLEATQNKVIELDRERGGRK